MCIIIYTSGYNSSWKQGEFDTPTSDITGDVHSLHTHRKAHYVELPCTKHTVLPNNKAEGKNWKLTRKECL